MKITYAGVVIAAEPSEGGFDTVQDFVPGEGEQFVQPKGACRAEDEEYFPRGNRKRTLTGKVILASQPDLATAMKLRGTFYDSLPPEGNLTLLIGGRTLSYAKNVILQRCVPDRLLKGDSVGFTFTFIPNGPLIETNVNDITDDQGNAITDDQNNPITDS